MTIWRQLGGPINPLLLPTIFSTRPCFTTTTFSGESCRPAGTACGSPAECCSFACIGGTCD